MKTKRFSGWSLLVTALLSLLLTLALAFGALWALIGPEGLSMAEAMVLINARFVGDHDIGKAADAAMDGLITGLGDRWSYYVDAKGYENLKNSKDNAYVGIGVTVSYPEGEEGLYVEAVAENGPAAAAGLRPGDTILAVGEVRLAGEDRNRGTELIQGEAGTQVELLLRGGGGEERTVSVTRGRVEEHPVSYALLADGTGLITIQNFNSRCADEAIAAVDDLREQGAERLVFDVRNNGGGFLDELTRLLDYLLPEGPIFRSQTKAGRETVVSSDAGCVEMPMAVLVNENTYSAAELFAAELQEWDWGEVVGVQTFGKGFSQQTFPLLNGGAVNLSTAKYFTGQGNCLIGVGLTPDRVVELDEEQAAKLRARILDPAEDPQLQAAIAAA
ncbi:S41 family peptidase [Intestinimonas massiliensis (ex Afouda et al. 2020)]|jgi:carboxyl-terminal processing protease|uniref:S41 family peptidase n=1 Tax=Intestinimonas massiliensis (ex Afouda et al. 2020) TaxID=1673721 RepID=A0ABS9MD34_9FIRM|nr:S41 family peptidase [Intestinimonas massiliensis (ex Afouda et al. 2020)]MCG4528724.1 S41 family peptidase [Intestinimonas massiliensis (ex Afouda et al. 2020)]MCQ4806604.1 S41 family peptidase [Intestinimonas massiliensis (ex Afouda et al. 2020)]